MVRSLLLTMVLLTGCSWVPKGVPQLDIGVEDRGIASWYGSSFHGKLTANGERFDKDALTAAHRTLPFGSVVRVVNLANGKHLHVRITDRGPYVNNRIIDLSYGAAVRLGMMPGGLTHVRIQLVGKDQPAALLSADASEIRIASLVRGLEHNSSNATIPPVSTKLDSLLVNRLSPCDVWIQPRSRRLIEFQTWKS